MEYLWKWVVELPLTFSGFFEWLTQPLPYLEIPPLALFSVAGVTILVGFLLVRLVVGG